MIRLKETSFTYQNWEPIYSLLITDVMVCWRVSVSADKDSPTGLSSRSSEHDTSFSHPTLSPRDSWMARRLVSVWYAILSSYPMLTNASQNIGNATNPAKLLMKMRISLWSCIPLVMFPI